MLPQTWTDKIASKPKRYLRIGLSHPFLLASCLAVLFIQAEADRLIFEDADPDTGFVLHPDLKWVSIVLSPDSSIMHSLDLLRKKYQQKVSGPGQLFAQSRKICVASEAVSVIASALSIRAASCCLKTSDCCRTSAK